MRSVYLNETIGDAIYTGLSFGGRIEFDADGSFARAAYPGLRAIRILRYPGDPGEWILARDLGESYSIDVAAGYDPLTPVAGRILGYAETTTPQTGITSITDLTGLSVTATIEASRLLRVSGQMQLGLAFSGTETLAGVGTVRESTTTLGRFASYIDNGSGSRSQLQSGSVLIASPSAGSHTYKLSLQRTTGAGSVSSDAGSGNPSWILLEDLGPASAPAGLVLVELYY